MEKEQRWLRHANKKYMIVDFLSFLINILDDLQMTVAVSKIFSVFWGIIDKQFFSCVKV